MDDLTTLVGLARMLIAVCILISAAEYLSIRSQFRGAGILSMDIQSLERASFPGNHDWLWRFLFSYRAFVMANGTRLVLGVALFVDLNEGTYAFVLFLLCLLEVYSFYLCQLGHDGSDQMLTIATSGLAVAYAFGLRGPCAWIGLGFVVGQSLLAYFTSGVAKLISPLWRSGRALLLISNTACYGSPKLNRFLSTVPKMAVLGCWSVITFECCMPAVLFVSKPLAVMLFAIGLVFHLGCAVAMGLNCFLWAFVSTYPLLYLFNDQISRGLSIRNEADLLRALAFACCVSIAICAAFIARYHEIFSTNSPLTLRVRGAVQKLLPKLNRRS